MMTKKLFIGVSATGNTESNETVLPGGRIVGVSWAGRASPNAAGSTQFTQAWLNIGTRIDGAQSTTNDQTFLIVKIGWFSVDATAWSGVTSDNGYMPLDIRVQPGQIITTAGIGNACGGSWDFILYLT